MYFRWNQQTITDFSDENTNAMYNRGFVFTRVGKGVINQTRSLRIDLSRFELSSENRRILRKTEEITLEAANLPYKKYHWSIGKTAKDFYEEKFGAGTFSANKVKELLTSEESNFNRLFVYTLEGNDDPAGYCIARETNELIHYSYPFYSLTHKHINNIGMGMMLRAIVYAKEHGKKYIYLGSFQRPGDTYKLQFAGLEWFDGEAWGDDLEQLKQVLTDNG